MIVTARGRARPDYTPEDVDREFVMAFQDGEEVSSWLIEENTRTYVSGLAAAASSR